MRKHLVFFSVLLSLCFLGCGKDKPVTEKSVSPYDQATIVSAVATPSEGGSVTIALEGEPLTLNPVLLTDINSQTLCVLLYDSLISHDHEMNFVPRLASSWDVSEDRLTITFHLRKDVTWHDGVPFTSKDVKFTYDAIMDRKIPARTKADIFGQVSKVETPDSHTFKVTYKTPFAPCFESWETLIIPRHIFAYDKASQFKNNPANMKAVGTGPFKFKEWNQGHNIILDRNENYFAGKPYLDSVAFRFVASKVEALALALQEQVQVAPMDPTQWQLFTQSQDFSQKLKTIKMYQLSYDYIAWNADGSNPFFSDKNVRTAMTHALDRKQIIERILYGLGKPLSGPFVPDSWAYDPGVELYPYDLTKASDLLAGAGWNERNNQGILEKDGKPFEFSILVREDQEIRIRIAELLKSNLEKIGVKMNVTPVSFKEWVHRMIETHDFEASIGGWNLGLDPDPYNMWFSGNYPEGMNFVKFNNPRVDKLLLEGRQIFDREERRGIYWELHSIIHEEQPYTFLYVQAFMYACDRRIQNIKPCSSGLIDQYPGVFTWYIPRGLQ